MKKSIRDLSADLIDILQNQDGTITGGFISVHSNRYRVIINGQGQPPAEITNGESGCNNDSGCLDTHNTTNCNNESGGCSGLNGPRPTLCTSTDDKICGYDNVAKKSKNNIA